ncbi:response regulator [Neokomagataea thailandica]|uniref:Two hybrid sensor histidine kinase n=1 Tax=Neokomagataea tanensis NBRC 106556 TaxID=1223519 RepID=A0ABQ0QLC7_9PROT|nr:MULTISPECIES: response regulator [Neokomagataea]GBR49192.1 two hybrid sensor histidine kinase [Neokomagataea tanensis NBRC 106556]
MTASRTALVVEDDFIIRLCLTEYLQGEDFITHEASSLADVEAILKDGPTFDVLITDYYLAGSNGLDVVKAAHKKQPRLPVVYISGKKNLPHTSSTLAQHITKPYALEDVLNAINALTAPSS